MYKVCFKTMFYFERVRVWIHIGDRRVKLTLICLNILDKISFLPLDRILT
jgi:hypothetical protein